jgi:preprotein translocase subunit SecG
VTLEPIIITVHIITCLSLILVVLLQSGKGADMGASFGGSSQAMFGSSGGNLMTRLTTITAITFMATSLSLALISSQSGSVFDDATEPTPVATSPAAAAADLVGLGEVDASDAVDVAAAAAAADDVAAVVDSALNEAVEKVAPVAEAAPAAEAPAADPLAP